MKRLIAAVVLVLSGPAAADIADMTADERTAFHGEVRAYLLENPEVIMEAIAVLEARQAEAEAAGDADALRAEAAALFDDPDSYVGGNPEGDVTVVEFLDYRCGYCRRAHPEVAELVASDADIRIIVKEFPILGEQSMLGSRFAIATLRTVGDAAYAAVSDALMTQRGDITPGSLRDLAISLDLDADAVMAGMDDPEIDRIIADNRALAQRLRINGTPSFVFGDTMVRGYVPLDAMREIVAEEREG